MSLRPYFQLIRPANTVTAACDVLAGAAIAGGLALNNWPLLTCLGLASMLLYAGGVSFNDVCDVREDKKNRPERPLPSAKISYRQAWFFSISLSVLGIALAFYAVRWTGSYLSATLSLLIFLTAALYDKWAKHHLLSAPLTMGLCRALNLLLGMSVSEAGFKEYAFMGGLPLIFVAAITLTSQGETSGKNKEAIVVAMGLDVLIVASLIALGVRGSLQLAFLLPFLGLWWALNLFTKIAAITDNRPEKVMRAVKYAVLSLIPLNACYAAGFNDWKYGLFILSFLPLSLVLARYFSVT